MTEKFRINCGTASGLLTALRTIKPRKIQYRMLSKPPVKNVNAARKRPSTKFEEKIIRWTNREGSRREKNSRNATTALSTR